MKLKVSEHQIQKVIEEYLGRTGWLVWRNNSGKVQTIRGTWIVMGKEGMPDLFALKDGLLIGIECKSATGRTTEAQEYMLGDLRKHGAATLVARSVEEVERFIKIV